MGRTVSARDEPTPEPQTWAFPSQILKLAAQRPPPSPAPTLFFSGLQPWHMEVPRLGVESELQLPAYTTATATQDPS